MRTIWKVLISAAILAGVICLVIYLNKKGEEPFNKIELFNQSYIDNRTELAYIDTIVSVGLDMIDVNDVDIRVLPLPERIEQHYADKDFILEAYIVAVNPRQFYIYVDPDGRVSVLYSIAHELLHLKQHYAGDLIIGDSTTIYKGVTYKANIPYENKPWEIDAHENDHALAKEMRQVLVK